MRKPLGELMFTVYCESCGFESGKAVNESVDRCGGCGQFVKKSPDVCCREHEVRKSPYPSDECPYCEEERNIRAQREHMITRDPMVEPW